MFVLKKIFEGLGVLICIVILGLIALAFFGKYFSSPTASPSNETPTVQLQQSNPDFNTGLLDQQNGDYSDAAVSYQKALAEEATPELSAQIEYYLAVTYESEGDYSDAIHLFQQIAAKNAASWSIMAAYAIQSTATIHFEDPNNQQLTSEIFSEAPYSSFGPSPTTTLDEAYRNLYAYAASIYPLGISETRVALWYAQDLYTNLQSATTSAQGVQDLTLIQNDLQNADTDVQRIQSDPVAGSDIPEIRSREALIEGYLSAMGAGDVQQEGHYLQDALNYNAAANQPLGLPQFYGAVALSLTYGHSGASQIESLLSVFTPEAKVAPYLPPEFTNARTDPSQATFHQWLVTLGNIDPSFKTYLISLGWQQSDFNG